jgi:hypothetical protein
MSTALSSKSPQQSPSQPLVGSPVVPSSQQKNAGSTYDVSNSMLMKQYYLWAVVIIVFLVVVFWYGNTREVKNRIRRWNTDRVHWVRDSKVFTVILTVLGVVALAWACGYSASCFSSHGDDMKCKLMTGVFLLIMVLLLAAFLCLFSGRLGAAYWLSIAIFVIGLLGTAALLMSKMLLQGFAMMLFVLVLALPLLVATYRIRRNNRRGHHHHHHGGRVDAVRRRGREGGDDEDSHHDESECSDSASSVDSESNASHRD